MAPNPYETPDHFSQLNTFSFDAIIDGPFHIANFAGNLKLRAKFRYGTFRYVEEANGFSVRAALVPFCQVARDTGY